MSEINGRNITWAIFITNNCFEHGDDLVQSTDWHNATVFKPSLRASVEKSVAKGQRALMQGRIMYGSVEDKMGQKRHTTTVAADDVIRIICLINHMLEINLCPSGIFSELRGSGVWSNTSPE